MQSLGGTHSESTEPSQSCVIYGHPVLRVQEPRDGEGPWAPGVSALCYGFSCCLSHCLMQSLPGRYQGPEPWPGSPRAHGSLAGSESPHLPFQAKLGISDLIPTYRVGDIECVWSEPGLSPWVRKKPSIGPEKTKFQLLPPLPCLYPWSLPSFVCQHWKMTGTLIMGRRVTPHCCLSRPVFLRM